MNQRFLNVILFISLCCLLIAVLLWGFLLLWKAAGQESFFGIGWETIERVANIVGVLGFLFVFGASLRILRWVRARIVKEHPKGLPAGQLGTICEVKNIDELEKVSNNSNFVEKPLAAEFRRKGKKAGWTEIRRQVLESSGFKRIDIDNSYKVIAITGKPGTGKSLYMLWNLEEALKDRRRWFKKILFLNPALDDQWTLAVSQYSTRDTLLVVDGVWRDEPEEEFRDRCKALSSLLTEEQEGIGEFTILVTMRDDEYERFRELSGIQLILIDEHRIDPEKLGLDFANILKNHLRWYDVAFGVSKEEEEKVADELVIKSENNPTYVHELAKQLADSGEAFSHYSLKELPQGITNLVWQTICRVYRVKDALADDIVIPFLLILMSRRDQALSEYFFGRAVDILSERRFRRKVKDSVQLLKRRRFQTFFVAEAFKNVTTYSLSRHWKSVVSRVIYNPNLIEEKFRSLAFTFKEVSDERFLHMYELLFSGLTQYLVESQLKEKQDPFLIIDLARWSDRKLRDKQLRDATYIYIQWHESSPLPNVYIKYVLDELYRLWILKAWRCKGEGDKDGALEAYEIAFYRLQKRDLDSKKDLHAYATYLTNEVLPGLDERTQSERIPEIKRLYEEVIDLDPNEIFSWQAFALFHKAIGDYDAARKYFEKALTLKSTSEELHTYVATLQPYAIFLKEWGNREWFVNREKALLYFEEANQKFDEGLRLLEKRREEKGELSDKEKGNETMLINAYANFLVVLAGKQKKGSEKRQEYNAEADQLFSKLIDRYPDRIENLTLYTNFLMIYGASLPKYKDGMNLREAKRYLGRGLRLSKEKRKPLHSVALCMLARLLYKFWFPPVFTGPPAYAAAERLLRLSIQNGDPRGKLIFYHELASLYINWARFVKHDRLQYDAKMDLARETLLTAVTGVPENVSSFLNLSKAHMTLASCFALRRDRTGEAEKHRDIALDLAKKAGLTPVHYYPLLTTTGDEIIEDEPEEDFYYEEAFTFYDKAISEGNRLGQNTSYAYFRRGQCHERLSHGKTELLSVAVDDYLQAARKEDTAQGYATRRKSTKTLMKRYGIWHHVDSDLSRRCVAACKECSEKAYQRMPESAQNCYDYGEDLNDEGKDFNKALEVLSKSYEFTRQDKQLDEREKRKRLSRVSEQIRRARLHLAAQKTKETF